ncbi:Uncharacterized protein Fot_01064 [Forsythia ovata]|uniref:Uncharacterized protein n=1 Tax=Forsythia ovata TaxID=205694 RepID=A0ABD1X6X7_9LAMI
MDIATNNVTWEETLTSHIGRTFEYIKNALSRRSQSSYSTSNHGWGIHEIDTAKSGVGEEATAGGGGNNVLRGACDSLEDEPTNNDEGDTIRSDGKLAAKNGDNWILLIQVFSSWFEWHLL